MQHLIFEPGTNPDILGLGVLDGVGQRFLYNAIERGLDRAWQAPRNLCFDMNRQIRALGNSLGQKTDCGNPAKIIQDRWPKFMGIAAQMFLDLAE